MTSINQWYYLQIYDFNGIDGTDSSGDPAVSTALARVNVITSPESFPLVLSPLCSGPTFTGRWTGNFAEFNNGETVFPPGVTISSVQSGADFSITLSHDGLDEPFAPFEIDEVTWRGRTPAGAWDATAPGTSFQCPGSTSGGDIAPFINVLVVVSCP